MKKRIVSIMLVMCLLSLVACQNGASDSNVEFERTNGTVTTIPAVIAVMIDLNN